MTPKKRGLGYDDIADILRSRIASGELPPGSRVPSEPMLMEEHGVSRGTATKALQALRDEGLTETRRGSYTRVRRFHPIRRPAAVRLSSDVWGAGASMWDIDVQDDAHRDVRDLEVNTVPAASRIAAALGMRRGADVVHRSRTYEVNGKPVMTADSWLPGDIAAGTRIAELDTGPGGIYARLAELGHAPTGFREELQSRQPTKRQKVVLQLQPGTPVIHLVRTARDGGGRVVEVNQMVLDSSMYILEYEIPA